MRFSREHLCFKALCVLDEAMAQARAAPLTAPPAGLRFALAYLWAGDRSGDRKVYDDFWSAVFMEGTDYLGMTNRNQAMDRAFIDIAIRAGHGPSAKLRDAMWIARGMPRNDPVPPDGGGRR